MQLNFSGYHEHLKSNNTDNREIFIPWNAQDSSNREIQISQNFIFLVRNNREIHEDMTKWNSSGMGLSEGLITVEKSRTFSRKIRLFYVEIS